jgi:putative transposase
MPNYRRVLRPGGTFFFTVVTFGRSPFLCTEHARAFFRNAIEACRGRWPFEIDAFVLLPDHTHSIWTLPDGDCDYSKRWAWIKREFSSTWLASGGTELAPSEGQLRQRRRGVWQPRFWEHTIRDDADLANHFDYIHFNPVKHGLARCPHGWNYSSFHRHVAMGNYDQNWQCCCDGRSPAAPDFADLPLDQME